MRCKYCDTKFEPRREWQLFCKDKCKVAYNRENKEYCFYCGDFGNHRDHIHAVNLRGLPRRFAGQETVYACAECNVNLSDNMFDNVVERIDFLIKTYEKLYKKELRQIKWDDEDLAELGPTLRSQIKKGLAKRRLIEERMKYLHNVKIKLTLALVDDDQEYGYLKNEYKELEACN